MSSPSLPLKEQLSDNNREWVDVDRHAVESDDNDADADDPLVVCLRLIAEAQLEDLRTDFLFICGDSANMHNARRFTDVDASLDSALSSSSHLTSSSTIKVILIMAPRGLSANEKRVKSESGEQPHCSPSYHSVISRPKQSIFFLPLQENASSSHGGSRDLSFVDHVTHQAHSSHV